MSQPKESPEIEFLIHSLILTNCRIEAISNLLEKHKLVISKEQIEKEAQILCDEHLESNRDLYISALNLERGSIPLVS
jgi:hypothetical protein